MWQVAAFCYYLIFVVAGDTEDDLRQLLQESEINAQRLRAEVQAQEQEQVSNKIEMEKVSSQIHLLILNCQV